MRGADEFTRDDIEGADLGPAAGVVDLAAAAGVNSTRGGVVA